MLRTRLEKVEHRLRAACARAGRPRESVTLVAVTKTVSAEIAALLPELGVLDLGENRPQELWRKAASIPNVRWHLIGNLQRNKIERTLPLVHTIHAVDSVRLLQALDDALANAEPAAPARATSPLLALRAQAPIVLLEVNASREASKHGFTPDEVPALAPTIAALKHVHVAGLMTMAALEDEPERCRPTFVLLRELRDRLQRELGRPLSELSMGMTNDFEVAVEEGATMVRLGTALFEGLQP